MPIFAIVIKKRNGNTLVKFKSMKSGGKKVKQYIRRKLEGTGHTLKAINYVSEDPQIDYDYPYRRRRK